MRWRLLLILLAMLIAFFAAINVVLQNRLNQQNAEEVVVFCPGCTGSVKFIAKFSALYDDFAESAYPFRWQVKAREQLRTLLYPADSPPTGTDEAAIARYAEYALEHRQTRAVILTGMRRDPRNALYHYLLAYHDFHFAITGNYPKKTPGAFHYTYTVKDRRLLDEGLHELAVGMKLPFRSRRDTLLRARFSALKTSDDYIGYNNDLQLTMFDSIPEYSFLRDIARRNGYFLTLLLSEGKRTEAEPFVHTGERLGIQLLNDAPYGLTKMLVAQALIKISSLHDVDICRQYGLNREADDLARQCSVLMQPINLYRAHHTDKEKQTEEFCRKHSATLIGILMPIFGLTPGQSPLTVETLRPGRLMQYVFSEKYLAGCLLSILGLLLLAQCVKYLRWKRIARATETLPATIALTAADWARIVCWGFLLPLAIYLLYFIGLLEPYNPTTFETPYLIGIGFVALWIVLVPESIAARRLWKQTISQDLMTADAYHQSWLPYRMAPLPTLIWAVAGLVTLALPVVYAVLSLVSRSPFLHAGHVVFAIIMPPVTLAILLIPSLWERHHPDHAAVQMALSRNLATVFAALVLLIASLIPICGACERHYLQSDTVMGIIKQGPEIGVTKIEGYVVSTLRNDILAKAKELHVAVE